MFEKIWGILSGVFVFNTSLHRIQYIPINHTRSAVSAPSIGFHSSHLLNDSSLAPEHIYQSMAPSREKLRAAAFLLLLLVMAAGKRMLLSRL